MKTVLATSLYDRAGGISAMYQNNKRLSGDEASLISQRGKLLHRHDQILAALQHAYDTELDALNAAHAGRLASAKSAFAKEMHALDSTQVSVKHKQTVTDHVVKKLLSPLW